MSAQDIIAQRLAQNAAQIKTISNDPKLADVMNTARQNGNTLATDNEILNDRASLTPYDFYRKYGDEITTDAERLDLRGNDLRDRANITRTANELAGDALINVGSGALQLGGAASYLAGVLTNRDIGLAGAQLFNSATKKLQSFESDRQMESRTRSAIQAQLDQTDNDKQFQKDIDSGSSTTVAQLKRFGRGVGNAATRLVSDSDSLFTGITEGAGSMLAGGLAGRAIAGASNAMAGLVGRSLGVTTVDAMPVAIGLMESGGVYQQVATELLERDDLTHDKLMGNPQYQADIANGVEPAEAKLNLIQRAASRAAQLQMYLLWLLVYLLLSLKLIRFSMHRSLVPCLISDVRHSKKVSSLRPVKYLLT